MRVSFRSVRARLTLWYTGALAVTLAALAAASLALLFPSPDPRDVRLLTDGERTLIRDFTRAAGAAGGAGVTAAAATIRDAPGRDLIVAIYDSGAGLVADNAPAASGPHRVGWRTQLAVLGDSLRTGAFAEAAPVTLRARGGGVLVQTARVETADGRYTAAALLPLHTTSEIIETVQGVLAVTLPLALVLAGIGGYVLAGRALAPMRAVTVQTARIGPGSLDERIPIPREAEVAALATVVNGLLERVERSFTQQRRFMSDASHELRTPVAILRVEADIALGKPTRTEREYRESLRVMQDAAGRLSRIVEDLFLLSRVDAGDPTLIPGEVRLDEIIRDAVRAVRGLADQRGISIDVVADARSPLRGDPALLDRLLLNLLRNAVSYSGPRSTVRVVLDRHDGGYRVTVADSGPGIAPEDQPRIFDRFFRADKSRSRDAEGAGGAGLGLPIARWIAEAHGGRLTLASSTSHGTVFELWLPAEIGDPPAATPARAPAVAIGSGPEPR